MKSRTSFFNLTVFRKNITRFAPVWVLYTICLLLILFGLSGQSSVYMARDITGLMQITVWGSFLYAAVVALYLFGDLYNSRLCNAIHAFPMRRDGWLLTNVATGILFSLVPNVAVTAITGLILGEYAYLVWIWLSVAMLQFLFFYGTAVLSAMCAGNRLGMMAVYGIINFVVALLYVLTEQIYQPLIYGIQLHTDSFIRYFPFARMLNTEYVRVEGIHSGPAMKLKFLGFVAGDWRHLAICAVVGILLVVLAWRIYRRRQLERAGDFIAFKPISPVFMVIYTVGMGAVFYMFSQLFGRGSYLLMAAGFALGFFTGRMLLNRTLRVFNKKAFAAFGLLVAVMAGSMLLTWLDPLGITQWVPELDKVERAAIYGSDKVYVYQGTYKYNRFEITEKQEIGELQALHRLLTATGPAAADARRSEVNIQYTMDDGRVVRRTYMVAADSEVGQRVNAWFSDARYIFQVNDTDILYEMFYAFNVDRYGKFEDGQEGFLQSKDKAELKGLLDAILADCEAGIMTQSLAFHTDYREDIYYNSQYGVRFELSDKILNMDDSAFRFRELQIWSDCTNTIAYLDTLFAKQTPAQ